MILLTKLTTGEELISDTQVVKVDDMPVCLLIKPCQVVTVPTEQGIGAQLIPWLFYAKEHKIPISLDMILTQVEVNTEMYNKYNGMFGSGIQVVSSNITTH